MVVTLNTTILRRRHETAHALETKNEKLGLLSNAHGILNIDFHLENVTCKRSGTQIAYYLDEIKL